MGSEREAAIPEWASEPCIMGINEAGRGPVLGPMVYGCLYCTRSYQNTLSSLNFADSKTLKEEKREELFENLKADESIGWAVNVIDSRELSAKMLKKKGRLKLWLVSEIWFQLEAIFASIDEDFSQLAGCIPFKAKCPF
ncbi:hypothetical protein ACFX13_028861 [Malus domestica]